MNGIQRVRAAVYRQYPDRIPRGELVVDSGFIEDFMSAFPKDGCSAGHSTGDEVEMKMDFCRLLGLDLVCIPAARFNPGEKHFSCYTRRLGEEGIFIFALVDGAFQTIMNQLGFMDFCTAAASDPEGLGRQIQSFSGKMLPVIDLAVQSGAHGIIIADDIAYNQGCYVSPSLIKKYLLPCWQEQVDMAKRLKVPVFYHSDGNIGSVLPLIVEAGFDGLQCLDPAAGMDIKEVRDGFGQDLCLMGNIDPALLYGRDSEVLPGKEGPQPLFPDLYRATEDLILAFGPEGGLIFGTSCGLYKGLSPEKVLYMYRLAGRSAAYGRPESHPGLY